MPMKILQARCVQCGKCLPVCPNEGITTSRGEYTADPELCTQCYGISPSPACVEVCPTEAVVVDFKRMESMQNLAARAASLRPDLFHVD